MTAGRLYLTTKVEGTLITMLTTFSDSNSTVQVVEGNAFMFALANLVDATFVLASRMRSLFVALVTFLKKSDESLQLQMRSEKLLMTI